MTLNRSQHINFILSLIHDNESAEYLMTLSIRTNHYYWALSALYLMGGLDKVDKDETLSFILSTQSPCGGFAGYPNHDPHIHTTLSAIQCLILLDSLNQINVDQVCDWVASLQNQDGSFRADEWGEIDTKYVYCGLAILSLLGHLDIIDVSKSVEWILSCQNFDGGFGCVPGCESHSGQILTSLGALSIADSLNRIQPTEYNALALFLSERQDPKSGGLNSRPEKLPDTCYSWWTGASLAILNKKDWLDSQKLENFVLSCQNAEHGGLSDRPGNAPDPFHTFFSCAGLSLFNRLDLPEMDPTYALPKTVLNKHFSTFNKK